MTASAACPPPAVAHADRPDPRTLAERRVPAARQADLDDRLRACLGRQAFLLALDDALVPLADPAEVQRVACERLARHLRVHRVAYAEIEGDFAVVRASHAIGVDSLPARFRQAGLGGRLLRRCLRGDTVVVDDVENHPDLDDVDRARLTGWQVHAFTGVMLHEGGRRVAAFGVQSAAPRTWSTDELQLIREVAERTRAFAERARAQAAHREDARLLRAIADLVPDLLWTGDAQGRTHWLNRRWREYTGLPDDALLGYGWPTVMHPDDLPALEAAWGAALRSGTPFMSEHRLRAADGSWRWHLVRAERVADGQDGALRWFGSATDVHAQRTARDELERRVAERTRELRDLLAGTEQLQDDERRRIALELHESLGQHVLSVDLALRHLGDGLDDADARARVDAASGVLRQADRELDRLVFLLRPTALDDCGLAEAVAAHAATWSELWGVPVDLALHGWDGPRLPAAMESAVFRVVQEALVNVAKHAGATRVGITLERRRGQLSASIEDDGRGFELAANGLAAESGTGRRWGLVGMRERVAALGGRFAVESVPGSGTTVLLRMPIARAPAAPPRSRDGGG